MSNPMRAPMRDPMRALTRDPMRATGETSALLTGPELRGYLERFLRRRVPACDIDDSIQAVLCAALEARRVPTEREELRKWVTGIARRKIAALYRRASREQIGGLPEIEVGPGPLEESAMLRWAECQAASSDAGGAEQTLEWMAREGDGEKLESIAAEAKVPAARVRQRVSRLRRWLKARWVAELAAVAALSLLFAGLGWWLFHSAPALTTKRHVGPSQSASVLLPDDSRLDRAREARRLAFVMCDQRRFHDCLQGLDEAARLDPAGDADQGVIAARNHAAAGLAEPSPPSPSMAPRTMPAPNPGFTTPGPSSPRRLSSGGGTPPAPHFP